MEEGVEERESMHRVTEVVTAKVPGKRSEKMTMGDAQILGSHDLFGDSLGLISVDDQGYTPMSVELPMVPPSMFC